MPSILIVDDEAIFRKGLRSMIHALDPEWNVVGDAKDGYEALDLLAKLRPDAMLTDIRMPRMDGIQLQKIAREQFPALLCVVVSGFEDFTYVKQSMRHGAKDYLMKPVERDELGKLLQQLKRELLQQEKPPPQAAALSTKEDRHARERVSEHWISALMRDHVSPNDLRMLQDIGIAFHDPYFTCMIIKLDKESVGSNRYDQADPSLFQLYIQQFVQEMIDRRMIGFSFVFSDSEVVAVLNMPDHIASKRKLLELAESIRLQIKSLSNLTVTIGIGQVTPRAEALPKAYQEADIALLYRLIVGGDKVLEYEQVVQGQGDKAGAKKWSWESVEQAINEGKTNEIDERVTAAVTALCRQALNPETVHQHLCKLLLHYYELTEEWGLTKAWLGEKDIRTLLFDVCSISSSEELTELCRRMFGALTACIASGNSDSLRDPVAQTLRYMERHYHEPLKLTEVAERVFLNPAYFSTLFKQRTGTSFVERLTALRVEAAKQRLATTGDKIAAVAEQTGFANIRHFNRVFKSETGVSPKEYRDVVKSRGSELYNL
jgi:two-component system response regulator YesN